jgi:tetratricopeptide (TPR) repeat protein
VAGMKPKIICPQCGSALARTDLLCPSCGVAVDWEDGETSVETASQKYTSKIKMHGNTPQSNKSSISWTSKSILGAAAVIALIIIAYEVMDERRPGEGAIQQPASQPMSAAVQMAPEIQDLENRVAAQPNDMTLTLQLANLLHDGQFFEKAIPFYKKYLMKNPGDANARVDMGICMKELGKFSDAKNEMKTALHYVPNHLFAHYNLGIVCLSEGNIQESNTWFKKTVALDPASEVGKRAQQLLTQHNSQTPKQ